jgi:uncharacterized protein YqgC (DUF456 family)
MIWKETTVAAIHIVLVHAEIKAAAAEGAGVGSSVAGFEATTTGAGVGASVGEFEATTGAGVGVGPYVGAIVVGLFGQEPNSQSPAFSKLLNSS